MDNKVKTFDLSLGFVKDQILIFLLHLIIPYICAFSSAS